MKEKTNENLERKTHKYLKNKKAITLIALVITIVVLVILASVAITLSLGNNGIFNKAKYAKQEYLNSKDEEETQLAKTTNQIDDLIDTTRNIATSKKTILYNNKANSKGTYTGVRIDIWTHFMRECIIELCTLH